MSSKGLRMNAKALARWKKEFSWVDKYPGSNDQAYCTLCKQTIQPKRDKLLVHHNSKTHREMTLNYENYQTKEENIQQSSFENTALMTSKTGLSNEASTANVVISQTGLSEDITEQQPQFSHSMITSVPQDIVVPVVTSLSPLPQHHSNSYVTVIRGETGSSSSKVPIIASVHGADEISKSSLTEVEHRAVVKINSDNIVEHHAVVNANGDLVIVRDAAVGENSFAESQQQQVHYVELSSKNMAGIAKIQNTVKFPEYLRAELESRLISGQDSDAVWRCQGAVFRVHKFVLALNSGYLKRILDEELSIDMNTPDLSCVMVRSILCLFYTGRVIVNTEKNINELLEILHLFECQTDKLTTELRTNISLQADPIPATDVPKRNKQLINRPVKVESPGRKRGRGRPKKFTEQTTKVFIPTEDDNIALEATNDHQLKVEFEEDAHDDTNVHDDVDGLEDFIDDSDVTMTSSAKSGRRSNRKRRRLQKEDVMFDYSTGGHNKENEGDLSVQIGKLRDTKSSFYFMGKNKGLKCQLLADQLFSEDLDSETRPVGAFICTICYQYFQGKDKLMNHNLSQHSEAKSKRGEHYVSPQIYNCPTCSKQIKVQHIAWFIKHLKFCGTDDNIANDILGPDDIDQPLADGADQSLSCKKEQNEDCLISGTNCKGSTVHKMTKSLLGVVKDQLWGCRTCYEAFSSSEELEEHRDTEHQGELSHGKCYDAESKQYTCLYCNSVVKTTHLIHFIKHLKQCLVDPVLGLVKENEEDGLEDDTTEEIIDPWGVINKPLRIINLRSQWVCEALIGKIVPILYPCHICYTVFTQDTALKEHFSAIHPDKENCCENGELYNKDKDSYFCTVCKQDRCKNQRSSIYFTYHMRKCQGKGFPVCKSCDLCGKQFNNYRRFVFHTKTSCEKQDFICHICSMPLKSNKDLTNHIQYVHTDARPFFCTKCSKTFKRKGDLVIHEQSHNTNLEFSCEVCGKAFNLKKNLRRHIQIHNPIMERPHQCPHCNLRFLRKQVLDNHIATHTTARKFSCDICSVRVKTRDALKVHRKKVHKERGPLPTKIEMEQSSSINGQLGTPMISSNNSIDGVNTANIVTVPHSMSMEVVAAGSAIPIQNVHVVNTSSILEGGVPVAGMADYTLTGMKTPASEIPVKEEVIISQFQIITSM